MSVTVNLSKGQRVNLTAGTGVKTIRVGTKWDMASQGLGGLVKGIFGGGSNEDVDIDTSVIMVDGSGRAQQTVYFGKQQSSCGSIRLHGDNRTGGTSGKGEDSEKITINLATIPQNIQKLILVANIYDCVSRRQDFSTVANASARVYDEASGAKLCEFPLTDSYKGKTAIVIGEVYRHDNEWKFNPTGDGTTDTCIADIAGRYR